MDYATDLHPIEASSDARASTSGYAAHVADVQRASLDAGRPYPFANDRDQVVWMHPDRTIRDGAGHDARVVG